jgi:chloramphenicol O-acetyltransferase
MENKIIGDWQYDDYALKIESTPASQFLKDMTTADRKEKKSTYENVEDSLLYSRSYVISFVKKNYRYYMVCCLTRINDELYADIQSISSEPLNKSTAPDNNSFFNTGSYINSHSIAKIILHSNEMEIRFLNGDFIAKELSTGSMAIKYEKDDLFNLMLVTASSNELHQFLNKYGRDERLYSRTNTVTLKKI